MKTTKLAPPEYPWRIERCIPPDKFTWRDKFVCWMLEHTQCGYCWEQHSVCCCRCGRDLRGPK